MKIAIAGAGDVGTHLAKLLSQEKEDIILIDENQEKLNVISSNFDLMTYAGSPISLDTLEGVGINDDVDLFIALTPHQSENITACMLASNLGAKKTIARIDNNDYLSPKSQEIFHKMGVNSLIYPEHLAAQEIINATRRSWVRSWFEFSNGKLILLAVKIRENAEILDIPLKDLGPDLPFHIVAIIRNNETLIPHGDDMVKLHDIVYFTTTPKNVPVVRKVTGKEASPEVRKVIIMGGTKMAIKTALTAPDNLNINIIENDPQRIKKLNEHLQWRSRCTIFDGDASNMDFLVSEGLQDADAFIALSDDSETNILTSLLIRQELKIKKTIAEVENLDYLQMAESFDIGTIINKKLIAASYIHQMMLKADVNNVKSLTLGNAEVSEFTVKEDSRIAKKPVRELKLPKETTVGGLVREGEGFLVKGNTQIQPGDHVIVLSLRRMNKKIDKLFQ